MPLRPRNEYKPLTEDEKRTIIDRHNDFVNRYDSYLQVHGLKGLDTQKLYKDLLKKLDDPKVIAKFRIVEQIKEDDKIRDQIAKDLKAKYPSPEGKPDILARSFKFLYKLDGSEKSNKYNEELIKAYNKDPKAFAYARMKNILNFNANKLIEIGDDEVKQLEWIRDNPALGHEANEFGNPIDPTGADGKAFGTSNALGSNLPSMMAMFQKINYAGSVLTSKYDSLDYLAVPDNLGKDVADNLFRNTRKYLEKDYKMPKGIRVALQDQAGFYDTMYSVKDIADKLRNAGFEPGKDMLMKYYAVKTDPDTGKETQVGIDEFMQDKPNVSIKERTPGEIEKIKYLTKDFELKYNFEFQKRMGQNLNIGEKNYNVFRVLKEHRSGFFARDSKEYKEFAKALADFTNPEKAGHVDKEDLRKKVDAYLAHTEHVKPGKNNTDPVRRGRIELANAVKTTLRSMDQDGVQHEISNKMVEGASKALDIPKEPAFENDELVNENEISYGPSEDSFELMDEYLKKNKKDERDNLIDIPVNKNDDSDGAQIGEDLVK